MFQSNIYEYLEDNLKKIDSKSLLVCNNTKEANEISDIANLLEINSFVLPDIRIDTGEDLRAYQDEFYEFIKELGLYYLCQKPKVLISPYRTLNLTFPKEAFLTTLKLSFADKIDKNIKNKLFFWGYNFVDIVTARGEVSFRGDIIDIYPINEDSPYRISLFDNDIESIRRFDVSTQKSIVEEIESFFIFPAFLSLDEIEYNQINEKVKNFRSDVFIKDIASCGWWVIDEYGNNALDIFKPIAASKLESDEIDLPLIKEAQRYKDIEVSDINKLISTHKNKEIIIVAKNESIVRGSMIESFEGIKFKYQDGQINILGSDKLIISINKPTKLKKVKKSSIILDELKTGDYVVHETHGVGIFKGIEKRDILGATREFVVIVYQNEDMLLVPVENLEVIDRYISDTGSVPVLDRLGKMSFRNLKDKVKEKLFAIASQIINLSAIRHMSKGIKIELDPKIHSDFLASAGFIHTSDQEDAISDTLSELRSGNIMDRLLIADVGFGKTEVAMNAIFACVKSGYQACMIAPTTLLSSQHYKSLIARLGPYGIRIAKLDRFCSAKEKKDVIARAKSGEVDVIIGTHALFGVEFAKLALVVIDEEHKFGVKQKEALKEMTHDVHLLSMSATPIPRSLNLALSSVKTFSEILTPPHERVGVRTFVKSYDEAMLKEIILRELRRGGQIFYVHNSIASLEDKKASLLKIIPNLKIAILHSKISSKETEDEMIKFQNGEFDILLSTSIVESGIHIPNANTMIVDGSNNFGMADIHQLRGRVGRGSREGYCYFLVEDKLSLSEQAKKRLIALESHSDLGSGAALAFHDLEIRGGGNIIGEAQSGHIKQIGYGLYLRMLEDAIKELSGKKEEKEKSVEVKLAVDAYLSEELINEDRLRLELYRRLSLSSSIGEVYEISSEIEDRFGRLDRISKQFIDIMAIKLMAKSKGITKVSSYNENLFFEFEDVSKERLTIKAPSRDDDDIIATAFGYLKQV
ncbi:MAG: transcription-repair coupling factor [Sulfurovum sp. AS07-7]|nr:MAG: transcription-repair coupling factor [Sulfurovum sp. AS07-7]